MAHKHSLEALNRTLKDIKNNDEPFSDSLLLFSGDLTPQLLDIGNGKVAIDESTGCITLPTDFYRLISIVFLK
jgi:hypothetical protein